MSTAKELKKEIERGVWDASLGKLYGRRAGVLERQRARYADALDCFVALYGGEREAAIYSAPGRTEIGGNHTDHNHGVVMAGAVDLDVIAVVSKNTDGVVRVKSKGFDGRDEVKLEQLSPVLAEQGRSAALIRGVAAGIAKQGGVLGGSTPIPRPMCCAAQGCPVRLRSRLSLVLYSMGNTTKAVSPR